MKRASQVVLEQKRTESRFSGGTAAWRNIIILMDVLYKEHELNPLPAADVSVHTLAEVMEIIFRHKVIAQHGYVEHLRARDSTERFELAGTVKAKGHQVKIFFNEEKITERLGYFKIFAHSWLLHPESGVIIDVIHPGGEFGVDFPTRYVPHEHRPPYNVDCTFELLRGELPSREQVGRMADKFEAWAKTPQHRDLCSNLYW